MPGKTSKGADEVRKGRPPVLNEDWSRITTILTDRHLVILDKMAIDFRFKTKRPISRSDILRAMIDLIEDINITQALDNYIPVGVDDTTNDILKAVFSEKIKSS